MNQATTLETNARPRYIGGVVANDNFSDRTVERPTIASASFNSHMEEQFRLAADLLEAQGAGGYRMSTAGVGPQA